jgi:hypothetical protein
MSNPQRLEGFGSDFVRSDRFGRDSSARPRVIRLDHVVSTAMVEFATERPMRKFKSMMESLHAYLGELERDRSLCEPERLRERIEGLDRLETYLTGLQEPGAGPDEGLSLRDRITALCADWEAINSALYQSIRRDIQRGAGADALFAWAAAPADCRSNHYDHLDALIGGVLQIDEPVADVTELAADMVFYQPTPAHHIFDLIRRTDLDERDVLFDLGAGLGHVVLTAALCSRARCIGIEQEAAFVACARRSAQALNLDNASFIEGDAREADLSFGTVFYLYTPFTGAMLIQVLGRLQREAARRTIRIVTLGPCTPIIARESWLQAVDRRDDGQLTVFRSI